jgi:UDPglucose 6-dehydrogenase
MKIGIIGAGRLGICFALLCEQAGYDVLVSDVRDGYVKNLQRKIISTNEPEVAKLLTTSPRLSATTNNLKVIRECDVIYTLVATPSAKDGSYDVSAVWKVVEDLKKAGKKNTDGKAFVVGCTTNPGDCEKFQNELKDLNIDVFYNPEFIAQGTIIKDLRRADMVLIGGKRNDTYDQLCEIYNRIQETPPKISIMSTNAAELVKLAVNCYLTTKISYANMVGQVMSLSGMEEEIPTVLGAIGDDSRVGRKYLNFGFGFGGPCLPRDNRAFAAHAKQLGLDYNLGETTDNFNNEHATFLKENFIYKNIDNLPFYFDYVSYKQGTDILTESQQYKLCIDLLDDGYTVYINDNDAIMDRITKDLSEKYPDTVKFGEPEEEVFTIKF